MIDITWIPDAKAAWMALCEQEVIVTAHIGRLLEKRDRYPVGSLARALAGVEVAVWVEVAEVIRANLVGKTVSP